MCKVLVLSNLTAVNRKAEEAFSEEDCLLKAETAEEAWEKIAENKDLDFVIIDDELPREDGSKLLKHMRSEGLDIPAIMLGDLSDSQRVLQCFELGADDYMEAVGSAELLRAKIHVILRRG